MNQLTRRGILPLALALSAAGGAVAQGGASVLLEDLTWTELAARIKGGWTTIILPVGGVEQSGPHMALGKHDARVKYLSGRIAQGLGNALVAPVVAYVPEGALSPPTEHMRFPGTITAPVEAFRQILESAAMSFKLAGFLDIVILGDHGGYQGDLKTVATELNRRWAGLPTRCHYIAEYYQAAQTTYQAALRRLGYPQAEIGVHAGLADTSLTLAIDPGMVRRDRLGHPGPGSGVQGDPTRASAQLGELGVNAIITETIRAIRNAVRRP